MLMASAIGSLRGDSAVGFSTSPRSGNSAEWGRSILAKADRPGEGERAGTGADAELDGLRGALGERAVLSGLGERSAGLGLAGGLGESVWPSSSSSWRSAVTYGS